MIFVDSSFWIAQAITRDGRHADAARLSDEFGDRPLGTTNLVVGETWTFLRRREGHGQAMKWLDRVTGETTARIEPIDADLERDAWDWLRQHDERTYSFVDATSFALMRKLRIKEALAFDGDFTAAGFVELRP